MIKLTVNGIQHSLDVSDDTPLLWAIRDELKLTGTKFGCGAGLCGACTVHLDGAPVRSCLTTVAMAAGHAITTIEGLGTPEQPHPLQTSWIEKNVPQCGYCQSGQLMSAAALLTQTSRPTDDDISSAMSGNICRCGTYPRIRAAIHLAADAMATAKESSDV